MVLDVEGVEIVEATGEHGARAGGAVTLRFCVNWKSTKKHEEYSSVRTFKSHILEERVHVFWWFVYNNKSSFLFSPAGPRKLSWRFAH